MLPIADLHTHPLLPMYYFRKDLGQRHRPSRFFPYTPLGTHIDIHRLKKSGVRVIVCCVYAISRFPHRNCFEVAKAQIALFEKWVSDHTENFAHARTPEEVESIVTSGKIAAVLALEGGHHLAGDLSTLDFFKEKGVFYITLVHFMNTPIAESSLFADFSPGPSLRPFGREAIRRMRELRIVPDVAHCSERAFWEIAEATEGPLLYSHGGAKALCAHHRNLTDEQAREIARRDGLIGLILYPGYLRRGSFWGRMEDAIRHLDHWLNLVGADVPAIGSDMSGVMVVREIGDYSGMAKLREAVVRVFGEVVARKILFDNSVAFMKRAWRGC